MHAGPVATVILGDGYFLISEEYCGKTRTPRSVLKLLAARSLRILRPGALPAEFARLDELGLPTKLLAALKALQSKGYDEHLLIRFNRTLKEQVFHGRIFKNLAEVRVAVLEFKDRYNRHWRLEKMGFMSPLEVHQAYTEQMAA